MSKFPDGREGDNWWRGMARERGGEWERAKSLPSNAIVVTDVTGVGHGREVAASDGTGNWVH